jgi:circadian clock protein KaiB
MTRYSFQLYVAGQHERSMAAEANLRALCDSRLSAGYEIDIIDVAARPDMAEEQRILATPTVIRTAPLPQRRVIGDLSDSRSAGLALGLPDEPAESGTETRHD